MFLINMIIAMFKGVLIKITTLLSIAFLFCQCGLENGQGDNVIEKFINKRHLLIIENDSCDVNIRERNSSSIEIVKNAFYDSPFLRLDCESISLKKLISLTLNVDTSFIVFEDNLLNSKHYRAFVHQKETNEKEDSKLRKKIIGALGLFVEKEFITVDTTVVSLSDKNKYLMYLSEQKNGKESSFQISRASLPDGSKLVSGSMTFDNYKLSEIMSKIGEEVDKTLVISADVNETITYSIKFSDWEALKEKLEDDLGLSFNTYSSQIGIYKVKTGG